MPGRLTKALCAPLLDWFADHARVLPWRENRDPYRVWVSEIMLQQTRVEAVRGYFTRFMEAFPSVHALAAAPEEAYLKLWEGLGYYSRVRNLHKAAVRVCEEHGGIVPCDYDTLCTLPGIGDYTAGAVASIAGGQRVPAVDGNVLRVVSRLNADERPVTESKVKAELREQVAAILPEDPGAFNQALMELGALVCVPNGAPQCTNCPVLHLCAGAHTGIAARLPNKAPKKARTIAPRTVFVLRWQGKVALRRRPERGLLAKLWEFPGVDGTLSPADARAFFETHGMEVSQIRAMRPAKHIFTHVEWHMTGYYVDLATLPSDPSFVFVTPEELRAAYALPSAFRAFAEVLE